MWWKVRILQRTRNSTCAVKIKNFMSLAGINTSQYKAHGSRAASTSHFAYKHFDLKSSMQAANGQTKKHFNVFIILLLIVIRLTLEVRCWTLCLKIVSV